MSKRILVCGGRDYADKRRVFEILDKIHTKHGIGFVIEGGSTGADEFAAQWIEQQPGKTIWWDHWFCIPAPWNRLGKYAGPYRNGLMLELCKPDAVVAFPGGRGTANMCEQAEDNGLPVWRIDHDA